ncbi:MAG TPA: serine hydrolase [Gemmatimonadaceae bacterium]|nr:serine hydrolase [Gemmatimonadaceae bacterium]
MTALHTRVRARAAALLVASLLAAAQAAAQTPYFPGPGDAWEKRAPEQVGLDAQAVRDAVALAVAAEATSPRDLLQNHLRGFGQEPHGEAVGPFRERGGAAGLIVRNGFIVAEWGDPDRPDNTFSVTKSFVSTTVGLAYDRKMIRDLKHPVRDYMAPVVALKGALGGAPQATIPATMMGPNASIAGAAPPAGVAFDAFEMLEPFASEHNRKITWDHLLRQTSDWQGTLWGKPDWADRPRGNVEEWKVRPRNEPGTVYTYNDVRVNLLALASLNIWRRPLPQVLREYVMDPIGASHTWRWYGYDNSWVIMDGQLVQSMSGGAHWGGGMIISARDMARFGYLTLRKGKWGDRQILSEEWIRMATTPGVNQGYGFMNYFLNTNRRSMPSAPEQAFWHLGAGNNVIYVDPVNDLVIVARWIRSIREVDGMVKRLLEGARPMH